MQFEIKDSERANSEYIESKLEEDCFSHMPPVEEDSEETLVFKVEDGDGNIIGGCIVEIDAWNIADLDILWVDEKYRKNGIGTALLQEAERAVRDRGCPFIVLGTFDFQARPFYEKFGYELCGTNENFPKGHEYYFLMKRIDSEDTSDAEPGAGFSIIPGDEEDAEFIEDQLLDYNIAQLGIPEDYEKLNKKFVDKDGNLVAGIIAGVDSLQTGYVYALWVEEPYRNQGLGSLLLRDFEREAKNKGCFAVHIDNAYDWQAEFFKKCGYTVTGVFECYPQGHICYSDMKKILNAGYRKNRCLANRREKRDGHSEEDGLMAKRMTTKGGGIDNNER